MRGETRSGKKREILVFGNRLEELDSLAFKVAACLKGEKKSSFREAESLLDEIEKAGKEIIVLDVVKGIKKVQLLKAEDLENSKVISAHDFDLASEIILLKKLHPEKSIKIIGIPYGYRAEKAAPGVKGILEKL